MGLALACIVRYSLICTTNCKQSKEKVDVLRAMGAGMCVRRRSLQTTLTATAWPSVCTRYNSVWCNQYDNLANQEAHYRSTGPEI